MKWALLLVAVLLCPLAARADGSLVRLRNIEFKASDGFAIARSDITVRLTEQDVRSPLTIEVSIGRFQSLLLAPRIRETIHGPARWQIRKEEAVGSGGAPWTLRIDHPLVTVSARQQREFVSPDFGRVWVLVDTIRPIEN